MPARSSFDYAIVRIVPRIERGECVNVGAILFCRAHAFLEARIELDEARLRALAPTLDPAPLRAHLGLIPLICAGGAAAGPIGQLSQQQRFHWLTSPRSTIVQTAPAHSGLCADPAAALEHLLATMVRLPPASG